MFKSESSPPTTGQMLKTYSKVTLPMVFTNIADQLMFFIDTIFAGHIGDESKLAAVGLGAVCNSMLVLSFLTGLNGA